VTEPVSPTEAFGTLSTYQKFLQKEGLPIIRGFHIDDLKTVEVQPWARKDAKGAYLNLEGTGDTNDAYICEIAPGKATAPQRHLYEEVIFVVSGRGATSVWLDDNRKQTFEWGPGSLFSPPLNAWHQHFNGQGDQPARLLGVTTVPLVLDLFHNEKFVFNNDFLFDDRFSGEADYFGSQGKLYGVRLWETNFVPDVRRFKLMDLAQRGAGGVGVVFEISNNTLCAHISEMPTRRYKKCHRHGPGAHVIIIGGEGYSFCYPAGGERQRVYWHDGSMFVPPDMWYHQHFNTSAEPARYLAIRWGGQKFRMPCMKTDVEGALSIVQRGNQIEYEDEDPIVYEIFKAALAKNGLEPDMAAFFPGREL